MKEIKCKICGKEFNTKSGLGNHILKTEKLSLEEYFLRYLDGQKVYCPVCKKETSFLSLDSGYRQYCSVKCAHNDPNLHEKTKKTNLERYGYEGPLQNRELSKKVTAKGHSDEANIKRIETIRKKYGVDYITQSKEFIYKSKNKRLSKIEQFSKDNDCTIRRELIEKYGQGWLYLQLPTLSCGRDIFIKNKYIADIEEYVKNQYKGISNIEKQLYEFIQSIYSGEIIENTRKVISPYELDIYIPDKNIAIEFNGNYWHNSSNHDKNYHLMKTVLCEEKGIRLIHIYEYEWQTKQNICKSIIASALGIYTSKVYARECEAKEVDSKLAKSFLEDNHIQGNVNSSYRLGLFYNNELVQLICIGKSRFKQDEVELLRMCTKLDCQVIGGFSKLIKNQKYTKLISYIDRSKFTGASYNNAHFKTISVTPPSYRYFKHGEVLNRISAQKSKLKKLLGSDNFNENLTEKDNMLNNGWSMLYDCGNIKVEYSR